MSAAVSAPPPGFYDCYCSRRSSRSARGWSSISNRPPASSSPARSWAARALAPVDLAIANWRGFVGARQSWQRLSRLLGHLPPMTDPMPLKPPARTLVVQNAAVCPPGQQKIVCQDANFTLTAGKALGVIGPTASGKSSLARMLVGVWTPARGTVRLDGATLDQWSPEILGRHIGYVPQDVELFRGTVAQNISGFDEPPDPEAVIAAAKRRASTTSSSICPTAMRRSRRSRQCPVGRPGAAGCARARTVPRPVPGRARRAEFQSRCGGRRSADPGDSRRSRARRHRRRDRASAKRHCRRGLYPRHGQGPPAAVRAQGRSFSTASPRRSRPPRP